MANYHKRKISKPIKKKKLPVKKDKWFEVAVEFSGHDYSTTILVRKLRALDRDLAIAKSVYRLKDASLGCLVKIKAKQIPIPKEELEEDWE